MMVLCHISVRGLWEMNNLKQWRVSCKKRQTMKRIMTAPKAVGEIRLIMKTPPEEKMLEGV
jgi:hypothetical protein